jgi:hypothetical protein
MLVVVISAQAIQKKTHVESLSVAPVVPDLVTREQTVMLLPITMENWRQICLQENC